MNLFAYIAMALLCLTARAAVVDELKTTGRLSGAARAQMRDRLISAGGCSANVCFAIDGSGSISREEFDNQRNFVLDIVSVIADDQVTGDRATEVAAVQYATSNNPITPLTTDIASFNLRVNSVQQVGGASFVVGGINYCFSQLFRRSGEANKIVLLGDGRSNIGSSAVDRADLFRTVNGSVCTVGAGFPDNSELLAISGDDPDLVFEVDSFFDVLALEKLVETLVFRICGRTLA